MNPKSMLINLYVDDLRLCPKDFIVARNFEAAVNFMKDYDINIISLDHDLGEDEQGNLLPTGYDIVKYICENSISIKKIYLHTDNPIGRENMYQTLLAAQKRGFISDDIEIFRYPYTKNVY